MIDRQSRRGNRLELFITVILLAVRIVVLLLYRRDLNGDALAYVGGAEHIVATGYLPPVRVQPQGFSILLAPILLLSGDKLATTVLCLNLIMDLAVVVSLVWLARRLLAPPCSTGIRLAASAAVLVQPFTATMVPAVYTEQFCQFCLFFGVRRLYSSSSDGVSRTWLLGSALLGAAALMRSELLPLNLAVLMVYFGLEAYRKKSFDFRRAALAAMIYVSGPLAVMAYQYASTGELAIARPEFYNRGYLSWMRTWFANERQYPLLHFTMGVPGWPGFEIDNYPDRAFDSPSQRETVRALITEWQREGYKQSVDDGFMALAQQRAGQHPWRQYVWNPAVRMCHFWVNVDGAQVILRAIPMRPPVSTAVVGLFVAVRLAILGLACIGCGAVWLRPSQAGGDASEIGRARLGSVAVLMRTLLMGIMGIFAWAGLMEVRYVVIVFPFVIVLMLFGTSYCYRRLAGLPTSAPGIAG